MCTKNGEQCDARKMNDGVHPVRLGGDSNHSMADKWHVPFDLCMDLLRRMKKQRPYGRYLNYLYTPWKHRSRGRGRGRVVDVCVDFRDKQPKHGLN